MAFPLGEKPFGSYWRPVDTGTSGYREIGCEFVLRVETPLLKSISGRKLLMLKMARMIVDLYLAPHTPQRGGLVQLASWVFFIAQTVLVWAIISGRLSQSVSWGWFILQIVLSFSALQICLIQGARVLDAELSGRDKGATVGANIGFHLCVISAATVIAIGNGYPVPAVGALWMLAFSTIFMFVAIGRITSKRPNKLHR